MKTSKYNYFIPYGETHIFFNGLTRRFFLASEKHHEKLKDIITHPDGYKEAYTPFLERMKAEGFVVEDEVDEMDAVKAKFEHQRQSDLYMLMILPTYQCNLRCWYCIQEHQNLNMTDETIARIKKHIEKYLLESGVKRFKLSWFGGEPLLAYKKLVDVTHFAQTFCQHNDIEFFCDITTNSLLLNSDRIKELGETGVRTFQITIDGCREQHNQVKQSKENTAFDKAVNNVLEIVKNIPDSTCILRINYSDKTLEPTKIMHDVNLLIPEEYRRKIKITPCKIWQIEDKLIPESKVLELQDLAKSKNYSISSVQCSLCYVDFTHFNCIFPNGKVGKCDNDKLENAAGTLTPIGDIVWETHYPFEMHQSIAKDSQCTHCKHLPFCMGPCPAVRDNMIRKEGKITCKFADADRTIENHIIRYCKNISDARI